MGHDRKILDDHKRKGKVLITPFNALLDRPLNEISWRKTILPEILWIGLLHSRFGDHEAVKLITEFCRLARKIECKSQKWFATSSSFLTLSEHQCAELAQALADKKLLKPLREGLQPLVVCYPKSSFTPILSGKKSLKTNQALKLIKETVTAFYDRSERSTVMAQADAIWLAFDADILKVAPGLSLAQFPEIEHYPATKLSKQIASSIRAGLNAMFGLKAHYPPDSPWPTYFWNHSLKIEPCELQL